MNSCEYKQGMRLEGPVCLTIGKFDGLHKGHRQLLSAMQKTGLPMTMLSVSVPGASELLSQEESAILAEACGVTTFVKRLEEFIYNLPAAPARKIITRPFRIYFRGIHTSWALCPTCSSRFMFPNSKPYTVCPYCGTVRKLEDRKEEPNE